MIESASAKFSRATYRVTGALNEILRRLTNLPQVSADDLSDEERAAGFTAAYAWFDEPAALERGQSALALPPEPLIVGRPVLGRVLIGDGQVCVEAGTTNRYQALRAQFEARVGRLVTFTEERVDDFGARLLEREPQPDFSRVPPALLARAPEMRLVTSRLPAQSAQLSHAEITARSARQMHERFLDQPVPLLNDHTPRQAAADPLLRPVLLTLMKSFVRAADQNNLRTGQSEDLNWMLRELNLPEIIFDPPPPRPATQKAEETDEADDIFAPPVAGRRMSEAEVRDRLVECQNFFISPVEMLDEFEAEVPELVEWIDDFAGESVNDEEWEVLLAVAAQVWYTYHPPGALATGWDLRQFLKFVDDEAARALAEDVMASVESFAKYLGGVRQPVLFGVLSAVVIKTITAQSQDASPRVGSEVAMLQILKLLIDGLDQLQGQ